MFLHGGLVPCPVAEVVFAVASCGYRGWLPKRWLAGLSAGLVVLSYAHLLLRFCSGAELSLQVVA